MNLFTYHKDSVDDIVTHVSKLQRIWDDLHDELKIEHVQLYQSMLLNKIVNIYQMSISDSKMNGNQSQWTKILPVLQKDFGFINNE
ncbi:hypothetical protein NQ314_011190 [Rhamnusium bicolor]|uniref:Uncharacterized protein n=1 Tax=Rhamnusium bicolor TaxID=1586634 RepID=A0AAV8XKG3_9CUCU|nr:hypothetical protein NQ314_011190 [Rhamnusium bicolor]